MSQVRTGTTPPLVGGHVPRPEVDRALAEALVPGAAVALVPGATAVTGLPGGTVPGGTVPGGAGPAGPGAAGALAAAAATGRDWRTACGKTQAAVAYVESLWAAGGADVLVWVTATSRASVLSSLAEAAVAVTGATVTRAEVTGAVPTAEAAALSFLRWLQATTRPWLIVLDDLASPSVMDGLWPRGPAGRVLITAASRAALGLGDEDGNGPSAPGRDATRPAAPGLDGPGLDASGLEKLPDGQVVAVIPVGMLTPHQSLGYLMGRLTADLDQRQGAVDLVAQLGNEPLALAQASAVIATSELTCRGYLDILAAQRDQGAAGAVSCAALTWAIAVEHAATLSRLAHPLLMFTSLLEGGGIPAAVYAESARRYGVADSVSQEGLAAMEAAGLLSVDRSSTPPLIRMSWAVQAAIRAATPPDALTATARAAADALLAAWPDDDQPEQLARSFRACAGRLQQVAPDALWQDGCHGLLSRAGQSLEAARLATPAAAYWGELAATSGRALGGNHPDTLAIRARLGLVLMEAGQADQAIAEFQAVLAERARSLGPDHPGTARACQELGRALLAAGRFDEATRVLDEAAAGYERATGADSGESVGAQEDLAAARARAGQHAAAIALYRRTHAMRQRAQGPMHPDTMATCRKLADAYLADGQVKSAISLYKRVLDEREKTLGPGHPDTIGARGSLAAAYFAAGRMSQALQLLEQVRAQYATSIGTEHRTTLAASLNLANAYHSVGRITDAARLLADTVERCERTLPEPDALTRAAREGLAAMTGAG